MVIVADIAFVVVSAATVQALVDPNLFGQIERHDQTDDDRDDAEKNGPLPLYIKGRRIPCYVDRRITFEDPVDAGAYQSGTPDIVPGDFQGMNSMAVGKVTSIG